MKSAKLTQKLVVCGPPEFERQARKAVLLYEPSITLYTNGFQPDETVDSRASRDRFQHGVYRKPEIIFTDF